MSFRILIQAFLHALLIVYRVQALTSSAPPSTYVGPSCAKLTNCVASIDLNGLILEVADSLVADGGLGLFIRCAEGIDSVSVMGATPLCGYADGAMEEAPDSAGGKTVAFSLRDLGTAVFFEQEVHTVGRLLESGFDIVGHTVTRDLASGAPTALAVDPGYAGARYFVPNAPDDLCAMNIGQFANDLAIGMEPLDDAGDALGASKEDSQSKANGKYFDLSSTANLVLLVQRLERDPANPSLLIPSRPISTLARDVTFENAQPMELGCQYGSRYWSAEEI